MPGVRPWVSTSCVRATKARRRLGPERPRNCAPGGQRSSVTRDQALHSSLRLLLLLPHRHDT